MFIFTGDTHGYQNRFSDDYEKSLKKYGEATWGADDILFICGDYGYIFANSPAENEFLDELEKKPYTICFCDGNHENFPAIYSYPKENWNGGKIHRIRKNIIHLMRGQVYTVNGKKIFSMGGAYSRDKYMRYENLSWWKEELPNDAEYREAISNLRENGYKVDYIITHTAPRKMILLIPDRLLPNGKNIDPHDRELTGFLDWIYSDVKFEHWFCGHWHVDCDIMPNFSVLHYSVRTV